MTIGSLSVRQILAIALTVATLIAVLSLLPSSARSATVSLAGYAWSDTVGWISFNCSNTNSCSSVNYGLTVATNGDISGYAWSDNIGWLSANSGDLAGCPSNPCTAKLAGNNLQGWMKALAGGTAESGGWDGWVSLNGSNYGPVQQNNGSFIGYAWGSTVVGWADFSAVAGMCSPIYSCSGQTIQYTNASCAVSNVTTCVSPAFCSAGSSVCLYPPVEFNEDGDLTGHLTLQPSLLPISETTVVSWNISNVESCTVSGSNGDSWTVAGTAGNSYTSAGTNTSELIMSLTTYTLTCTALDGTPVNETQIVSVLPVFEEN